MKYVLDASAAMAYLRGEPGANRVESLLVRPSSDVAMHAVNLLEVYCKLASYGGESAANEALDDLAVLDVKSMRSWTRRSANARGSSRCVIPFSPSRIASASLSPSRPVQRWSPATGRLATSGTG